MNSKLNISKISLILMFIVVGIFAAIIGYFFRQTIMQHETQKHEIRLIVYAPKSFISSFGPGEEIKKNFEKTCGCTVDYVDMGGAQTVIDKMKLDPTRRVDVVLGVDLLDLENVSKSIPTQEVMLPNENFRKEVHTMVFPRYVPYDWSPMGFVYRRGEVKPFKSLAEFLKMAPAKSLVLEDPGLSSAGLEWLYWIFRTQTNVRGALQSLRRVTETVAPTWSMAYGLFKSGQAKIAFSYLTSLVYHWQVEKDHRYQFMPFQEGQPAQIEYAFVPDSCWDCATAKDFVRDLLTVQNQKVLAEKNFMYPVIAGVPLSGAFRDLPKVKVLGREGLGKFAHKQNELIQAWQNF